MRKISNFQFPISNQFKNFKFKIKNSRNKRVGFTLIELMIVIAILAGLATLFMSSFPAAQKRGRDTKRRSDLKQYQTALEIYANKNGAYPSPGLTNPSSSSLCTTVLGLPSCPDDPKSTQHYSINSSSTEYFLWAQLEQPSSTATEYFTVCSSGKTFAPTGTPTSSACL